MSDSASQAGGRGAEEDYAALVAYLDDELDNEARALLEDRLARDERLRQRLDQYRQAWMILDELPGPVNDTRQTASTIEMVSVTIAQEGIGRDRSVASGNLMLWVLAATLLLLSAVSGYGIVAARVRAPYRELARELPLLERLDEYRYADDIDFLRLLADEQLFAAEGDEESAP